jgi:hemerythrin-like metal-binding protein
MTNNSFLKGRIFVSEWRDSLAVGDAQIDAEHRRLFMLVKQLDLDYLEQSVHGLKDYVLIHFRNEQELMISTQYPRLSAHIELHENFKQTIDRLWLDKSPWNEQRIMDLKRFLNEWLIGHIGVHDQHFGNWRKSAQFQLADSSEANVKSGQHPYGVHITLMAIGKAWRRWTGSPENSK